MAQEIVGKRALENGPKCRENGPKCRKMPRVGGSNTYRLSQRIGSGDDTAVTQPMPRLVCRDHLVEPAK